MIVRIARIFLVVILVVALVVPPPAAFACGPFFPVTIFIQSKHPDLPLEKYAAGALGVVQPSYARSYLVVAYRYFSGGTFTAPEQKQLVGLWAHRLGREQEWLQKKERDAASEWLEARHTTAMKENPGYIKKDENNLPNWAPAGTRYLEYDNCSEDAFLTAARTLKARARKFGPDSQNVRSWIEAQDAVFQNCGGANPVTKMPYLPPEADQNLPAPLHSDREYQIAAAHFYAANWDEAETRFLRISEDPSSPWRDLAAVVAVRCKLRKITLREDDPKAAKDGLAAIETRLRKLEADPSLRKLRPAIWRMRGYVEFRLTPEKRLAELARTIEKGTNPVNLQQDLDDYTQLLDRNLGEEPDEFLDDKKPNAATQSFARSTAHRRESEMTDWIVTYQASGEKAAEHALAKWKETRSLPWLMAALSKAQAGSPQLSELLEMASQVSASSRAFLTVAFHRGRLLAETGQLDQARQVAESILAVPADQLSASARNSFLALRMKLARNLGEFLQFAPRQPGVITLTDDGYDIPENIDWCKELAANKPKACTESGDMPPLFDADAATALTGGLPSRILAEAAASTTLPANLRRQLAQTAWVRAVLLEDEKTAHEIVPTLSSLAPDLSALLKSYDSEQSADSRRFAAVFLILHRPELHPYFSTGIGRETAPGKIDSYSDNWWCSFGPQPPDGYGYNHYTMFSDFSRPLLSLYPDKKFSRPGFLEDAAQKTAEKEWNDLVQKEAAAVWLGNQTLPYARKHPEDPRVPEALHLVVRATRYACGYADDGNISKSAFMLLHKKYPNSEWTKKTPYWF